MKTYLIPTLFVLGGIATLGALATREDTSHHAPKIAINGYASVSTTLPDRTIDVQEFRKSGVWKKPLACEGSTTRCFTAIVVIGADSDPKGNSPGNPGALFNYQGSTAAVPSQVPVTVGVHGARGGDTSFGPYKAYGGGPA